MNRFAAVRALVTGAVLTLCGPLALATPPELPTEIDTVIVRRTVVLTSIQGEVLRKLEDGSLVPVADGDSVRPGDVLLVRRGASFMIGNDTIGAETHGDRWVRFE